MPPLASVLIVAALLGTPAAALLLASYWLFIDTEPPTMHSKVELLDLSGRPEATFRRGDVMTVAREACAKDDRTVYVSRQLVDSREGIIYLMPSGETKLHRGCSRRISYVTIPRSLPLGSYRYVVTVHYDNNPMYSSEVALPVPELHVTE